MASVRRASGPSARGRSSSSATVTTSAALAIRAERSEPDIFDSAELGRFDSHRAVRPDNDLLDPQLGFLELGFAVGLQERSAFIDLDRSLQFSGPGLEFGDNLL